MERSLTPLALHPQVRVVLLIQRHLLLPLNIDLLLFSLAFITKNVCVLGEDIFTAKASFLNDCKLAKTGGRGHLRYENVPRMLSYE